MQRKSIKGLFRIIIMGINIKDYCLVFKPISQIRASTSDKGLSHAKYHAERGNMFMAIGHYQKAMYDFGTAIRFNEN